MQVFGDAGDSGAMPLGEPGQGLFKGGCTDQFEVRIEIVVTNKNSKDNFVIDKECRYISIFRGRQSCMFLSSENALKHRVLKTIFISKFPNRSNSLGINNIMNN